MRTGVAMAIETPAHADRSLRADHVHLIDSAVARHTADARGEMRAVIEVDEVRQCVDADPADRLRRGPLDGLGGVVEAHPLETTGWPTYTEEREGTIELDYILYSLTHNHRFRLRVSLPDVEPRVASAVDVYRSANVMEREVYDFFGVEFDGHPNLTRILMPDDWVGHPLRKDDAPARVPVTFKEDPSPR